VRTVATFGLAVAIAMAAGCMTPATPEETPPPPEDGHVDLEPGSAEFQALADARATAWHPEARRVLVATFEGAVPDWSGGRANPWLAPYYDRNGTAGDGRSPLWSYSYIVEDEVNDVHNVVCETAGRSLFREALVITLGAHGHVVAEFTTRDDDEGAVPSPPLDDVRLSSEEAAAQAAGWPVVQGWLATTSFVRTFLLQDWHLPGPAWVFFFELPDDQAGVVAVDARTGEVTTELRGPRC
jgi:hypothetical protein